MGAEPVCNVDQRGTTTRPLGSEIPPLPTYNAAPSVLGGPSDPHTSWPDSWPAGQLWP